MINETRERFIRTIVERLPAARIVEAHFFPAIRQGPIETGVAVIAAAIPAADAPEAGAQSGGERTEVFTASYRWTRKGPDRGKWEVEVTPEAHAPLATVEAVVRGVQERAGEALDAHRMSGDEIAAVAGPVAIEPAPADATAAPAAAGAAAGESTAAA